MHSAIANPPVATVGVRFARRERSNSVELLDRLAERAPQVIDRTRLKDRNGQPSDGLARYVFLGPRGGGEPIRLGIFAGLHGDEPEGVQAAARLLRLLVERPALATGYCLFVYPACNPTGLEDGTRHSRSGKDLNREFWTGSREPEVGLLERELITHRFQGLIALHTDDTSAGFYGYANGATLSEHLLKPALEAAANLLPLNQDSVIDGFEATRGVIKNRFPGVLRPPAECHPRPFEIILESPAAAPDEHKQAALVAAVLTVLAEYRQFIAYAANL